MSWYSALFTGAQSLLQMRENQKNRDFNAEEAQKARDYNTWLLKNQSQLKAQDARAAGLNPAFMNGSVLGNTPTPSSSPTSNGSITPVDLTNAILARSQARKNNADAEEKEIHNNRMKVEDTTFNTRYFEPNTDVEIRDLAQWMHEHPNDVPDMVRLAPHNEGAKGRFDATKAMNEFRGNVSDVNVKLLQNKLDEMVLSGQIQDPTVVLALKNMPKETYNKLVKECSNLVSSSKYYNSASGKFDSESALIALEKKLKEDTNIMPYVDKAFSGDFSLKDFAKVILLTIMGAASRVSIHN